MPLDGHLDVRVADEAVEFVFTVTNVGEEPVELGFPSGKLADVAVYRGDVEVWRWCDGRMFTQAFETRTLAQNQALEREFSWNDPLEGEYIAVAELEADCDIEVRTRLTI